MSAPEKQPYMVCHGILKEGILTTGRVAPCVWAPYQPETGRVDHDIRGCDDALHDLVDGWVWKKFNLVPEEE